MLLVVLLFVAADFPQLAAAGKAIRNKFSTRCIFTSNKRLLTPCDTLPVQSPAHMLLVLYWWQLFSHVQL